MRGLAWFMVVVSLGSPAAAQVINGESTYEDNYAHVPPAAERADKEDAGPRTGPGPGRSSERDLKRRDRD